MGAANVQTQRETTPWWKPTAEAREQTHGVPRQVVGRTQTPLPRADHQHANGRKAVGRTQTPLSPGVVAVFAWAGPRRTLADLPLPPRSSPNGSGKEPRARKTGRRPPSRRSVGRARWQWCCLGGRKTGAPLRGIRTASQRRSVGTPRAVIWRRG